MFNRKEIESLKEELYKAKEKIELLGMKIEKVLSTPSVDNALAVLKNDTEKRLIEFHKEITDKCFTSMETIMRYTKEVSLIETLANQVKDKDLISLQTALLRPIIAQREQEKEVKMEENIPNFLKSIIEKRDVLHSEYLVLNRQKKDTKEVEIRLEILNWIVEGLNDIKREIP
mgnify:CR=1 FL=1